MVWFFFWLLCTVPSINAQTKDALNIREFSYRNGLPARDINHIGQTQSGMMVICTSQGLFQFDGYEYFLYLEDFTELEDYRYKACYTAIFENNLLYLALEKEIICIDLITKKIISKIKIHEIIMKVFKNENKLHVFCSNGVIHTVKLPDFKIMNSMKHDDFQGIFQLPNKNYLVVSYNGIVSEFQPSGKLTTLQPVSRKSLEIYHWISKKGEIVGFSNDSGYLFYGDTNHCINNSIVKFYKEKYGPKNHDFYILVSQSYIDRIGNIWLVTNYGLFLIQKSQDNTNTLIPEVSMRGILQLKNGDLISGSYNGLYYKKKNSPEFERIETGAIGWSFIENPYKKDEIYILTAGHGISTYNTKTGKIRPAISNTTDLYLHNYQQLNDSIYLVFGQGIYFFNIHTHALKTIVDPKQFQHLFYSVLIINKELLLTGTSDGVYKIHTGKGTFEKTIPGECRWIVKTKKGAMAGVIGKGLYEINLLTLSHTAYQTNDLYQKSAVFPFSGMYLPKTDELLIGTGKGLFKIKLQNGVVYLLNSKNKEFNTNSLFLLNDNTLLAGGVAGLEEIDLIKSNSFQELQFQPVLSLIRRFRNNEYKESIPIAEDKKIIIAASEIETELYFSSPIDFLEKPFMWRYRIVGLIDNWVTKFNPNGRKASLVLTKLPHGNYTLEVQFQMPGSSWSPTKQWYLFVIPKWYNTIEFKVIIGIFLFLLVFFTLMFLNNRRRRKIQAKEKLEELRTQLMKSELRTLRNQVNPHMFANSMQTIQYFIYAKPKEEAAEYVSMYSRLMRKSLDNGANDMIQLQDEIKFIEIYCELEKMRRPDNLTVEIEIEKACIPERFVIPSMIIQPFVENAFKYCGVPEGQDRKNIKISFSISQNNLICHIFNSTKTENPTFIRKEVSGNEISATRIALYNELLKQKGGVEFVDHLYGFECIITIPHKYNSASEHTLSV